jgi:hypothetical protein
MTKVSKKTIDTFKNVSLTPKKTAQVKGGQSEQTEIIIHDTVDG